ncbi:MAG: KH domain-containing protein [Myxococcota bacterium]
MADLTELVEYIAKSLVENPQEVAVHPTDDGLELQVADDDRGRIIGRRGRTAHAIRVLLAACSGPDNAVGLDIVD